MDWTPALRWLAESGPARRLAAALLRAAARRRLAALDQESPARCQARILRGLVHRARNTPFGREHDFGRIRTPADFRRLVPLRNGPDLPLACPGGLAESHAAAALTALALVARTRPRARLLEGKVLVAAGGNQETDDGRPPRAAAVQPGDGQKGPAARPICRAERGGGARLLLW